MEKARRRRRVPTFGEWNYHYYSGEQSTPAAAAAEWYAPAPEMETCSDVWFAYAPSPRKPPPSRKARRSEMEDESHSSGKRRLHHAATPATASHAGPPTAARTPAKPAAAKTRVVRSVDADLYQVLPPDFVEPEEPRRRRKKKQSRSMWMACLGFSCVA